MTDEPKSDCSPSSPTGGTLPADSAKPVNAADNGSPLPAGEDARKGPDSHSPQLRFTLISIDPGRAKCGLAVVSGPADVACLHRAIFATERLVVEVGLLLRRFPAIATVLIGSGTGSAPLRRCLRSTFPQVNVVTIDEFRSSERGRERFVRENVPAGWRRIIPAAMRTPEIAYDDYVALILAEEYFSKKVGNMQSNG